MTCNNEHKQQPALANFSCERERQRLGPAGFRTFFNIAAKWNLSDAETLALLALGNETPIEQLRLNPPPQLFTEERLFRISYLIGIYKGLHICHGDELADRWVKLGNRNKMFDGISPLEFMIRGGQDAMRLVRRLIDARCQGY